MIHWKLWRTWDRECHTIKVAECLISIPHLSRNQPWDCSLTGWKRCQNRSLTKNLSFSLILLVSCTAKLCTSKWTFREKGVGPECRILSPNSFMNFLQSSLLFYILLFILWERRYQCAITFFHKLYFHSWRKIFAQETVAVF